MFPLFWPKSTTFSSNSPPCLQKGQKDQGRMESCSQRPRGKLFKWQTYLDKRLKTTHENETRCLRFFTQSTKNVTSALALVTANGATAMSAASSIRSLWIIIEVRSMNLHWRFVKRRRQLYDGDAQPDYAGPLPCGVLAAPSPVSVKGDQSIAIT